MAESLRQPPVTALIRWVHRIGPETVLNPRASESAPGPDFDQNLARQLRTLKGLFYSGQQFDYRALQASQEMNTLRDMLGGLHCFDPASLPTSDRQRAFWINLYNILILHGVIEFGIRRSVQEARGFFTRAAYVVKGYRFSANDIEHGVLRANAGYPFLPGRMFLAQDPRLRYVLPLDPRIHFALNCAARSCPPIAAYDGEMLDRQLDMATRSFVEGGGVEIDLQARRLRISPLFLWYRSDFAETHPDSSPHDALVRFIAYHVSDEPARRAMLETPRGFRIHYQKYDWGLNRLPEQPHTGLPGQEV